MTENLNVEPELSEQDKADLNDLYGVDADDAPRHTLLRIWSELLSNIEKSANEKISMGIAGRIVASYPKITFQETQRYHELYHEYLLDIRELLLATINDHPGCADVPPDDDLAENYELYKALIISWNLHLDSIEREWVAEDPESHIKFGALVDVRGNLFSQMGLAGHLDTIGFKMDTEEIVNALQSVRGES